MEQDRTYQPELQAARQRRLSLRRAMAEFEGALAAPASGRVEEWLPDVQKSLRNLQDCMQEHVSATEGPDGFHREIVTAAPRLGHQVEISVREHLRIGKLLDELEKESQRRPDQLHFFDDIRENGTRLIGLLARHRQRGADMIFEAYQAELGGED